MTIEAYLDFLSVANSAYMGYHSWDVTIGQILGSKFFMASIVFTKSIGKHVD